MKRQKYFKRIILLFVLVFFLAWAYLGFPSSLSEARFLSNLKNSASEKTEQINLDELMPGKWELVCESHGYDAPLYLKRYDKTFPTAGAMQDGSWGLIFIESDGSYTLVSSPFRYGIYLHFGNAGCLPRGKTLLKQVYGNSKKIRSGYEFKSVIE